VIHLGFGEASFPLHPDLRDALAKSAGSTAYGPVVGIPPLRKAIADYLGRERELDVSADQVVVGPGSKPLLYGLIQVLQGDVLVPTPSWVSYIPQVRLAGRRVIPVETAPGDHHRLTARALDGAVQRAASAGADPRVLIVNSPSNPTGSMFERDDVEALATWARAAGITIISDEIYAELAHGLRSHVSPAYFYPEGTIVIAGLSKSFSAGGWRLGYAALPAGRDGSALAAALRALASEIWSSPSLPIQEAAVVAFAPSQDMTLYVRRSARLHGHVAGRFHRALSALGVLCPRPFGAFYLYPDFSLWRGPLAERGVTTSVDLARRLLDEQSVATLPGVAFGEDPAALRLRLATSSLFDDGAADAEACASRLLKLLGRADELSATDPTAGPVLPLPALDQAENRFARFIHSLGTSKA
jgi:aspartate/methionine/tyrosine aminotransferase